jgi:HEAT repeat protein
MSEEVSEGTMTLDVGDETPLIETEVDEEILLAKDLSRVFLKGIRAFRFYPPGNPHLKAFREELPRKFQLFLNQYHSFVLQISEYTLSFKKRVLYENADVKNSLAFRLYKDGLRELRFVEGLEEWEIWGLIDIVIRSFNVSPVEDDSVTLMWEKDFVHIGYSATDELSDEAPVLVPENAEQYRNGLVFQPIDHDMDVDLAENEAVEKRGFDGFLFNPIEEVHPFVSNQRVYSLTSDDAERLRTEVESEFAPTVMFNIIDTVFEVLALEKEPEPYQDAANILNEVIDAHLAQGDFKNASDLLKRIYLLIKAEGLTDWQIEIIRKLIVGAGEGQRIERIGRILEHEEGIRLEDVSGYLMLLQRNSLRPLIRLLGEQKKSKIRRVIYDALSEIGKNAIEMLTPYLDDPRWYLVRNITYILGRIGKKEALPYLEKAFHHEEFRVRREAVLAMGSMGGSEAIGLLVKALADGDVRIRAMAAINLGKGGERAGLGPLLEVVQSKEFPKKEPAEIKAFLDAIGMIGSNESVSVLQDLLEKKDWLGRSKGDRIRLEAAQTLAAVGTPEAMAILESGKNSKEEAIREACRQALRSKYPNPAQLD